MLFRKLTIDLLRNPKDTLEELLSETYLPPVFYIWMVVVNVAHQSLYSILKLSTPADNYCWIIFKNLIKVPVNYILIVVFIGFVGRKIFKTSITNRRALNALLISAFPYSLFLIVSLIPSAYEVLVQPVSEISPMFVFVLTIFRWFDSGLGLYFFYIHILAMSIAHSVSSWKAFGIDMIAVGLFLITLLGVGVLIKLIFEIFGIPLL